MNYFEDIKRYYDSIQQMLNSSSTFRIFEEAKRQQELFSSFYSPAYMESTKKLFEQCYSWKKILEPSYFAALKSLNENFLNKYNDIFDITAKAFLSKNNFNELLKPA